MGSKFQRLWPKDKLTGRNRFLKSICAVVSLSISTACHRFIVGDGGVWVRGQIENPAETQCIVRVFYRDGSLANHRTVDKSFNVAMTIAPGTNQVFVEIVCDARTFRSKTYEVDSTSKIDLGPVTVK